MDPPGLRGLADDEQVAVVGAIAERRAGLAHCVMDSVGAGLCLGRFIGLVISAEGNYLKKEKGFLNTARH